MNRIKHTLTAVSTAISLFFAAPLLAQDDYEPMEPRWSFAIHGGAGTIARENMTPEQDAEYRAALQQALDAGSDILKNGGSAMDAVLAAIVLLEDDPKFNAGRGAVFTWEGENELDAALMDGKDRSAGAVTGVKAIKNPILLAREVMKDGRHVFLSGAGAEEFAGERGLETAPPEWFATEARREALERLKARQLSSLDVDTKFGTVGAVALDLDGNMVAGTSTGGLTGKRWGRIGDVPVLGAGTYADNRDCAVSATGQGEYFIRAVVGYSICTGLKHKWRTMLDEAQASVPLDDDGNPTFMVHASEMWLEQSDVQAVADEVMADVKDLGGTGGVIVVSPFGPAVFSFNTPGMYRGRATSAGVNEVAIYGDE
ncbi:isoaspartyl peptidase/L-asparaginase family protein [Erythrobacter litoralis]|uniref:Asparaginase family protein n=1 Tax=Erythrobacter litoralis (strain HTCC2594) TaxID=314225 RepID=Q2N833_ERYLH|nr:isoaspartyl peptidase/L-asparaginase [Erythrobacter litoralis]ABC64158.1 Asparaginase family protein [Erythrobacter litoralis HTCC2594]